MKRLLNSGLLFSAVALFLLPLPTTVLAQSMEVPLEEMEVDQTTEVPSSDVELQDPVSLLVDRNGDGQITIIGFGDSITRGVGDFNDPNSSVETVGTPTSEAGYPLRVELFLGLNVSNLGVPGERLTTQGVSRFAAEIQKRRPDIALISGGTNDAIDAISVQRFGRAIQTIINMADSVGTLPVLLTTPPVCCNRSGLQFILNAYEEEWRTRAAINELPLADVDRAYANACRSLNNCRLLNRPEGLHPNSLGYDVSGEVVTATLMGIQILEPNGPATFEAALGLVPGSVATTPNATPMVTPEG